MARSRNAAQVETTLLSGRLGPELSPLIALQLCHVGEMTGTLRARKGTQSVWICFRSGEITAVESLEHQGLDALVEFGRWTAGRFDFVCGAPPASKSVAKPFEWMMLEVCRRLDEAGVAVAS